MSTSDRGELITPLIRSIQTQANIFTLMPPTSKIKAYSVLDFINNFLQEHKTVAPGLFQSLGFELWTIAKRVES